MMCDAVMLWRWPKIMTLDELRARAGLTEVAQLEDSKNAGWAIAQARLGRINELHEIIQTGQKELKAARAERDALVGALKAEYPEPWHGEYPTDPKWWDGVETAIKAIRKEANHDHTR